MLSYIFKVTVFIEMLELILNAVFIIEDSHDIFFLLKSRFYVIFQC